MTTHPSSHGLELRTAAFTLSGAALLVAALAMPGSARAADNAIEFGAHGGVMLFDDLDQANTTWMVTPRIGYWFNPTVGLELDVGIMMGTADATDHGFMAIAPELVFVGNPLPQSPVQPILSTGLGLMSKTFDADGVFGEDYAKTRNEALVHVGTGLIIPIAGPLRFRTDARMNVSAAREDDDFGSPFLNYSFTGGLSAFIGLVPDTDDDGINDNLDLCLDEPEDEDGFEDDDGCPDEDNDADGVLDTADTCPMEPEDADDFEDEDGCPDADNDGDGILDADDICPNEAGEARTDGCPDADGDNIADKDDRCPDVAGTEAFEGCADGDEDGLADPDDECPTEAGEAASFGCPDGDGDNVPDYRDECAEDAAAEGVDATRSNGCAADAWVGMKGVQLARGISFSTGRTTLTSTTKKGLDKVAALLTEFAGLTKVEVAAHTNERRSEADNVSLTKARAEAIMGYLVEKGVAAERLSMVGHGSEKTEDGQAARRVEFNILEKETRSMKPAAEEAPAEEGGDEAPAEEASAE